MGTATAAPVRALHWGQGQGSVCMETGQEHVGRVGPAACAAGRAGPAASTQADRAKGPTTGSAKSLCGPDPTHSYFRDKVMMTKQKQVKYVQPLHLKQCLRCVNCSIHLGI